MGKRLRNWASAFVLGLTATAMGAPVDAAPASPERPAETAGKVALGVYDPSRVFSGEDGIDIEHIFVYWQSLDLKDLKRRLAYAQKRGRAMIVTVEPYTKAANWRDGGERLFGDIVGGRFDPQIDTVCDAMSGFNGRLLVRWGHEMEDPTGRYPWARADSEGYKSAYRYFVDSCRRKVPAAAFIWSPKGEKNLARYYPGDAHVDYVGLAVWGLQAMDRDYFGGQRDFPQTFREKYDRVAGFGKPVLIAELGVSGDAGYRRKWFGSLYDSISGHSDFDLLEGVVYFNDKEPHHWPMGYGAPDWRIETGWFADARQRSTTVARNTP